MGVMYVYNFFFFIFALGFVVCFCNIGAWSEYWITFDLLGDQYVYYGLSIMFTVFSIIRFTKQVCRTTH